MVRKPAPKKQDGMLPDEMPIHYLRRMVDVLGWEDEGILLQLKTTQAVIEFFDLWHVYQTDYWLGIITSICEGADPKPALDFIRKHGLNDWRHKVAYAVKEAKAVAKKGGAP